MAGDPKWVDVIERDLHRQFPFHEMFVSRGGHGLVNTISYTLPRFFMFFKEVSSAHQACIYLIQNTAKAVIL